MNIIRNLLRLFSKRESAADTSTSGASASPARSGDYAPFFAGLYGAGSALQLATVYRCVKILSESVANLPLEGNAYIVPVRDPASFEIDRMVLCSRHSVSHDIGMGGDQETLLLT